MKRVEWNEVCECVCLACGYVRKAYRAEYVWLYDCDVCKAFHRTFEFAHQESYLIRGIRYKGWQV
jgi:hypothetical protein